MNKFLTKETNSYLVRKEKPISGERLSLHKQKGETEMKFFYITVFCFIFWGFGFTRLQAQSIGGSISGAATYCSATNSGFLSLTGYTGTIINWESTTDGGISWTSTGNTTSAQSYFALSTTTCYRVIVQNGIFPPDTSTTSCITIYQPSNAGTIAGGGTFCSVSDADTLLLSGITGNVLFWQSSTDGGISWTPIADTSTFLLYSGITANTIYTAVVQNQTCPADTSTIATFTIVPASVGGVVSSNDTVCSGTNSGTLMLSGNTGTVTNWISSTDGGLTWINIPGTGTTQTYNALTQTTWFAAIIQNASCPADTSSIAWINILPLPLVSAGNDTTLSPGQSVTLQGSGNGVPAWTPSAGLDSSNIFTPVATPLLSTNYILTVTDTNGCVNSDAVMITVVTPQFTGIITTLFTPNGDGINDFWHISTIENYTDDEVAVYNIYGQQVFYKKNYMNDWMGTYNGKELPDGTYYYVLKFSTDNTVFKGSLDILRNK